MMFEALSETKFLAILAEGPCAWPGAYPLYFVTHDGEALSFATAQTEKDRICESIRENATDSWRVIAVQINWEDANLKCAHSGEPIDRAFGDDKQRT